MFCMYLYICVYIYTSTLQKTSTMKKNDELFVRTLDDCNLQIVGAVMAQTVALDHYAMQVLHILILMRIHMHIHTFTLICARIHKHAYIPMYTLLIHAYIHTYMYAYIRTYLFTDRSNAGNLYEDE